MPRNTSTYIIVSNEQLQILVFRFFYEQHKYFYSFHLWEFRNIGKDVFFSWNLICFFNIYKNIRKMEKRSFLSDTPLWNVLSLIFHLKNINEWNLYTKRKRSKMNVSQKRIVDEFKINLIIVNVLTSTYLAVKLDAVPSSLAVDDVLALLDASLVEAIIVDVAFRVSKMRNL